MLISKFRQEDEDMQEKVSALESRYGIVLPEKYRHFMLRYNGGDTPDTRFRIKKESSDVRAFFGIGDLRYRFKDEMEIEDWIRKNLLPIACDTFGNYIAVGLGILTEGKIYFCDHENGFKAKELAGDLEEFVKCCKSRKIPEECSTPVEERERQLIERGHGDNISDGLRKMWQDEIDLYGNMKQEKVVID
ncbi:MAG: SMI1/KNR4 family protein [Oscillospiraceae bacterium]|nr:SMI1/KNR4 family protein [Oscillospiraceae bacterium]